MVLDIGSRCHSWLLAEIVVFAAPDLCSPSSGRSLCGQDVLTVPTSQCPTHSTDKRKSDRRAYQDGSSYSQLGLKTKVRADAATKATFQGQVLYICGIEVHEKYLWKSSS